jgi:hypothetical protein
MSSMDNDTLSRLVGRRLGTGFSKNAIMGKNINKINGVAYGTPINIARGVPAYGTPVFAIGNPGGEKTSVAEGIISQRYYVAKLTPIDVSHSPANDFNRVITISCPINNGNSGGGLYDGNGDMVGMVQARRGGDSQGISYAIPIDIVARIANQVISRYDGINVLLPLPDMDNDSVVKLPIFDSPFKAELGGESRSVFDDETNEFVTTWDIVAKSTDTAFVTAVSSAFGTATNLKILAVGVYYGDGLIMYGVDYPCNVEEIMIEGYGHNICVTLEFGGVQKSFKILSNGSVALVA